MLKSISIAAIASLSLAFSAAADTDEDDLVRLPGKGEVRDQSLRNQTKADRLKPGAGLFITFDTDRNGRITVSEIDQGIPDAFQNADENQDGFLTAFEQQDWADSLPTRDDSLANPFRFDPNLDRRVALDEFTLVIVNLGQDYADEETGEILVSDLKAPRLRNENSRDELEDVIRERRNERVQNGSNQSAK